MFFTYVHVSFKDVAIMWWQSLKPQLKLIVLHNNDLEFVTITSMSEGVWFFVKQVGCFTMLSKLKLSQM